MYYFALCGNKCFNVLQRQMIGGASTGAMVRVEAELHEAFMALNQTGWAEAKLINSSVNCRFVGTSPFVVVPGMPFHATVSSNLSI